MVVPGYDVDDSGGMPCGQLIQKRVQLADRVACGTDRPQAMEIADPVGYVEAIPGITPREAEMILCENPARLLKL